jgi:NAD(P)-dependent dehydrogenase (short-subunit alcohol dehydrogenase family)
MSTDLLLEGRVAIVTGAGRGLGRSHALYLASRGVAVVVNDAGVAADGTAPSAGPAHNVVAEIEAAGGRAVASIASVADTGGAAAIVETARREFGGLDILVNNAGFLRDRRLEKMAPDDFRAVVDVHLLGSAWMSRAAWPLLRASGAGRLIHTTSAAGLFGSFGQANYASAKEGIVGLSRTLAVEGERDGIRSNVIAPVARTRMTEALAGQAAGELDPAAISPVVAFLASPSCLLTSEVLTTSGGHVARVFAGLTPGWDPGPSGALTPEAIADNLDAILSTDGFTIPRNAAEEVIPHLQRTWSPRA